MSATTHGVASGIVFGIVAVVLGQQFGFYSLSDLGTAIVYLVIGIVIGAVVFGLIGMALGRRYLRTHPTGTPPPSPGSK